MTWPISTYSTNPVSTSCPTGYTGTANRICGLNGWQAVNSTACQLIPVEQPTPVTPVTPVTPDTSAAPDPVDVYCSVDGEWPRIIAGSSANIICPNGYVGMMSRNCSTSGWQAINSTACQLVCPASTIDNISVPETVAGSSIKVLCDENSSSYATIKCGEDGKWGEMDKSECEGVNIVAIIILVVVGIVIVFVIIKLVGKSNSPQISVIRNNN